MTGKCIAVVVGMLLLAVGCVQTETERQAELAKREAHLKSVHAATMAECEAQYRSADARERSDALYRAAYVGNEDAVLFLTRAFHDDNADVRLTAVGKTASIMRNGFMRDWELAPLAIEPLAELVKNEPNDLVRAEAQGLLRELRKCVSPTSQSANVSGD
jgi:HEAT repeat protein